MKWAYGVTTVHKRFDGLLPRTLASLSKAGFDKPRLFVDSDGDQPAWWRDYEITHRSPPIYTFGNWMLAALELTIREPNADRYIIFQDDMITYPNLRSYLEWLPYPSKGYCNLYTFEQNEQPAKGWYLSNQYGRGAVALMFDNDAMRCLLRTEHMSLKPKSPDRGKINTDGAIVEAMKGASYKEYVHNPSLVQHIGEYSTMGNHIHRQAPTFKGESFDIMGLASG